MTAALVDQPAAELKRLFSEQQREEAGISDQLIQEFAQRFFETHHLRIQFTAAALDRLSELAVQTGKPVRDMCAERFKDFQFGLKLIAQNTGRTEFTIDRDAVEEPDKVLSDWVVASYRPPESA